LKVPLILQQEDFFCVPVCIKMVLEYIRNLVPDGKIPNLEVEDIAKIIDTNEDGTVLDNINNLNSNREVLRAMPSLRFEYSHSNSFSQIENEINANMPVIAWILISDNHREFVHSVVVTGVDVENDLIYFNDPAYGESQKKIGSFISMWEKIDTVLIKIRMGEREQRKITEYGKNKMNERSVGTR